MGNFIKATFTIVALLFSLMGCKDAEEICDPGTQNCACLDNSSCRGDQLQCMDDICVMPREVCDGVNGVNGECRTVTPRCYTPCSGPVLGPGGTERTCSNEGLMEGCLLGAVCMDGSCIPEEIANQSTSDSYMSDSGANDTTNVESNYASDFGQCTKDANCPDFQACTAGQCLSNCSNDSECSSGRKCVRKVCRQRCAEDAKCDDAGFVCNNGVCLPSVDADTPPTSPPDGSFELNKKWLNFTSHSGEGEFIITNKTAISQAFTVRKVEERIQNEDGSPSVVNFDKGGSPLPWLHIGSPSPTARQELTLTIGPGETKTVYLANARNEAFSRWMGTIDVVHDSLGAQQLKLQYSDNVDGRWAGKVYYFGNFEDGANPGDNSYPLQDWTHNRDNVAFLDSVPNAFLQAWGRFRNNAISLGEMKALLSTTLQGTWQSSRVKQMCTDAGFGSSAVCAPYGGSGSQNVLLYSSAGNVNRVPSGTVELDFAIQVRQASASQSADTPGCSGSEHCFVGKIDSTTALQYGGDPAFFLRFKNPPTGCDTVGAAGCISHIDDFGAQIAVGSRYIPTPEDSGCELQEGMQLTRFPWLVTGFTPTGVQAGENGEQRSRVSCRDTVVPFYSAQDNMGYAASNPVPDGLPRLRRLTIVDGIMIEQRQMLLLVREEIDPFHGGDVPLSSYAYISLEKQPVELEPADYIGSVIEDERPAGTSTLQVSCDDDLIREVTGRPHALPIQSLSSQELRDLARAVVRGDTSAVGDPPLPTATDMGESIHYLCLWREEAVGSDALDVNGNTLNVDEAKLVQREVFNAGPSGTVACPPGATVYYFALEDAVFGDNFEPATHECNTAPTEQCLSVLTEWANIGDGIRLMERDQTAFSSAPSEFNLVYRCEIPSQASCDNDALDLKIGKIFLSANLATVYFNPIETEIRESFRYKTQFVSRSGRNVGFAPNRCQGSTNLIPYCYDPILIEQVAKRADCALAIYHHHLDANRFEPLNPDDADTIDTLRLYLIKNFGVLQSYNPMGDVVVEHGFERLYSELLIMLGDDAYVQAFASRFDLAGTRQLAFDGDKFETGGVKLSGAVGYEMYTLYQATQYYDMVLERFYSMSPLLWASLLKEPGFQYVSENTITTYLDRVTRASTQSAAAWSEVARRYQSLNRPDLARQVLERAYARAYQESGILTEIMTEMMRSVSPAAISQVIVEIENVQRRYRVAMVDMRQAYERISDEVNFFGLAPNYIPFPALDEDDVNGIEVIFSRAREKLESAAAQEEVALASTRDFDVDEAEFQSELVNIRNNYEAQLGDLCGTFIGSDGLVHPAISRYAHLDSSLAPMDDPCGAAGNGELYLKAGDLQTRHLEMQRVRTEMDNLKGQFEDAQSWVVTQCGLIAEDVSHFLTEQKAIDNANMAIERMEISINALDRALGIIDSATAISAGAEMDGVKISAVGASLGIWSAAGVIHLIATTVLDGFIFDKQNEIRDREQAYEAYTIGRQCDYLTAELVYTLRDIQREMSLAELDALNSTWDIQVALSEIQRLNNERIRLEAEWVDSEQLTINVAAAKNDPNIRIYKNDAIINAERSFKRAIQEAYRATRIYEYYTATSYADFEQLFLIRMVNAGDYNLSRYLDQLEDAFYEFEDYYGNPDSRIALISMRDDVLKIPRYSLDGLERVLTTEERVELFRQQLTDGSLIDDNGNVTFQFSTDFKQLSPLTANHKILFAEVDMYGDTGDPMGRVYLSQEGTGVVGPLSGDNLYFTFPARTAVMNPVFNGDRALGQDADGAITGPTRSIYRSYRFRERPFVQTNWSLAINQRTETVNKDINLAGLDDIVLSIFYTDFTP